MPRRSAPPLLPKRRGRGCPLPRSCGSQAGRLGTGCARQISACRAFTAAPASQRSRRRCGRDLKSNGRGSISPRGAFDRLEGGRRGQAQRSSRTRARHWRARLRGASLYAWRGRRRCPPYAVDPCGRRFGLCSGQYHAAFRVRLVRRGRGNTRPLSLDFGYDRRADADLCGRFFYQSAWNALRHGRTNMDVPIALAVTLSYGMSLYETIDHGEQCLVRRVRHPSVLPAYWSDARPHDARPRPFRDQQPRAAVAPWRDGPQSRRFAGISRHKARSSLASV